MTATSERPLKAAVIVACYQQAHLWPEVRWGLLGNAANIAHVVVVSDEPMPKAYHEDWPDTAPPLTLLDHPHDGFGLVRSINQALEHLRQTSYSGPVLLTEGDEILPPGSLAQTLAEYRSQRLVCAPKSYRDPHTMIALENEVDHRYNFLKRLGTKRAWALCAGGHLLFDLEDAAAIGNFNPQYDTYGLHDFDFGARWIKAYGPASIFFGGGLIYHVGSGKERTSPKPRNWELLAQVLGELFDWRFNLGCDEDRREDYVNVDLLGSPTANVDIFHDCADLSWLPKDTVREFFSSHFIEHLHPHDVALHFSTAFKALAPGGTYSVIFPDVERCIAHYPKDPTRALLGIYGNILKQETHIFQTHRWGWTTATLLKLLQTIGFEVAYEGEDDTATEGHASTWRDSRVEVYKPLEKVS